MTVDFDDFVHRDLAATVAAAPEANGWFVDRGYCYDGGPLLYRFPRGFDGLCGTSLIVRADLLRIPSDEESADEAWVRRWLGSHVSLRRDLEAEGTPLAPLPFAGAIYRVGYRGNASSNLTIRRWFFRKRLAVTRPHRFVARLTNLRPITARRRVAFFGA